MSERLLQNKVLNFLRAFNNLKVLKIQRCNENGVPDIMILSNGKAYFIELKDIKGRLSPIQKEQIKSIEIKGGCITLIATSLEQVKEFYDKYIK